jgi:hypothetical protein
MSLTLSKLTIHVILIIALISNNILLLLSTTNNYYYITITRVYAQQPSPSATQTWIDKQNNLKVQFTPEPEKPVIDTPTELKFNIQNLQTGVQLKDLLARVVVTDGQRVFKFTNITVPNGNLSLKYLFPDTGTYQVIARIDDLKNNNPSTLSSFQVFVPLQLSGINATSITIIAIPVIAAGVLAYFLFKLWKRKKEENNIH